MSDTAALHPMPPLATLAARVAILLRRHGQTVSVAETSTGGLVSSALLSIPGASAFFAGGAVVYTKRARHKLLGLSDDDMLGIRAETEPYAALIAARMRDNLGSTWGLGESGASGPKPSPYGDPAGHACLAVANAHTPICCTLETGLNDRAGNMDLFARRLLVLFEEALLAQPVP